MRRVTCHECEKRYDYDDDGFCPRCGAFNAPASASRIAVDGSVVWVDGLNERNHHNSFIHEELHREKRKRRWMDLDRDSNPVNKMFSFAEQGKNTAVLPRKAEKKKKPGFVLAILVFVICINFIFPLLLSLFSLW